MERLPSFRGGSVTLLPLPEEPGEINQVITIIALVAVQTQSSLFTHSWALSRQEGEALAPIPTRPEQVPGEQRLVQNRMKIFLQMRFGGGGVVWFF